MPRDPDGLTLRQRAFVTNLTDPDSPTFLNIAASYHRVSPHLALSSRYVTPYQAVGSSRVQAAMAKIWTSEQASKRLQGYVRKLEKAGEIKDAAGIVMNVLEASGQLIRKAEVRSLSDGDRVAIRELVHQAISPSVPDTLNSQSPQNAQPT